MVEGRSALAHIWTSADLQPLDGPQSPISRALIRHLETLGDLTEVERLELSQISGRVIDLERGEDVQAFGENPKFVVIVLSGLLERYTINAEGVRQIHGFYLPNDTPSLGTLYMDVMDNTLGAVVPSRVGLIAHNDIYDLIDRNRNIMRLFWRETLVQGAVAREWLVRNSQKLSHAQMAHLFCEILTRSRAAGLAAGDTCDFPVSQETLGNALGMSSVHANRTLMLLRQTGAMEFRSGRLTVNNFEQLASLAGFDPTYLHLKNVSRPAAPVS